MELEGRVQVKREIGLLNWRESAEGRGLRKEYKVERESRIKGERKWS